MSNNKQQRQHHTDNDPPTTQMWFVLAAPACTDMLGTMFMMIGLLYVSVSVYQLVRCLVIVYVALLRVIVYSQWRCVPMATTAKTFPVSFLLLSLESSFISMIPPFLICSRTFFVSSFLFLIFFTADRHALFVDPVFLFLSFFILCFCNDFDGGTGVGNSNFEPLWKFITAFRA